MINPVASAELKPLFVYDPDKHHALIKEAQDLPSVLVSSATAANAVMMGGGYFTPLEGFMSVADAMGCAENMKMTDGRFFPVPVLNLVESLDGIGDAKRIALRDPNVEGNPVVAIQDVGAIEEVSDAQMQTHDRKGLSHHGSRTSGRGRIQQSGSVCHTGPIQVLSFSLLPADFPDTFRTAVEIRNEIRNTAGKRWCLSRPATPCTGPMRSCARWPWKRSMPTASIHMLLGKLKPGDIPAHVRDAAIRKMVELYFPRNTVMVTGYGFDMLYAGPREAVLHAVFPSEHGCHPLHYRPRPCGCGGLLRGFDAQTIFDEEVPEGCLEIEIFSADHTAYRKKLNKVVMMRDVPDHTKEDFVSAFRHQGTGDAGQGDAPPPEFSRPEVAQILMDYYQSVN